MSFDITVSQIDGEKILIVQSAIPDGASPRLKDALAIRRITNSTGGCPDCGATAELPNRAERRAAARAGKVLYAVFQHEEWCGCLTDDGGMKS